MTSARDFAVDILAQLPFTPNDQQLQVALALARFCFPEPGQPSADRVFILNGYAGTGKTSLTGALVRALAARRVDSVLMAPTGRAAKVFGAYARRPASTIHRRIYRHQLPGAGGGPAPRENTCHRTVFIVDEASMIGAGDENGRSLLTDLIQYVYSGDDCRLILLGDTAQLPPVGQTESPAMNAAEMRGYGLKVSRATLTEVARQAARSGILRNATRLRRALVRGRAADTDPATAAVVPLTVAAPDVDAVDGADLPDLLDSLYRADGIDETIVITRSNRSAADFNRGIRAQVLGYEEELVRGDLLIAAKNNYHWTRRVKGLDFVANGEILELRRVLGSETKYGMRFSDVILGLPGNAEVEFSAKIIPGCLSGDAAALSREQSERLFRAVYEDPDLHAPGASHQERIRAMQNSPYWNALQMKYAYAVTCHKAQGGQWRNVLVDLSYIPPEMAGPEFYRWLYTAVTRATSHLYFISPPEPLLEPLPSD